MHSAPTTRALFFLLFVAPPLFAATEAERHQKNLENLRDRIKAVQNQLIGEVNRKDELTLQLRDTERELGSTAAALRETDINIKYGNLNLEDLREKRSESERKLTGETGALIRQVRSAYIVGRQERVKLLLNQEDPALVGRMLAYYDYLNRARVERITFVKTELDKIASLSAEIGSELTRLQALRNERLDILTQLERHRDERARVLARLESTIRTRGTELERLRSDEKALANLVAQLQEVFADIPDVLDKPVNFRAQRGKLVWPADGRIMSNFGDSRAEGRMRWQGVMIAAKPGSEVRAISHGRVAYADWLPHYGLVMVIEHGDGFMSLYGHNQSLYKEAGDWVDSGDVVASIGATGGAQQSAALYFEIRQGRTPLDPRRWCVPHRG